MCQCLRGRFQLNVSRLRNWTDWPEREPPANVRLSGMEETRAGGEAAVFVFLYLFFVFEFVF